MVSAWASENGLVLGQLAVEDKSNENTAIPQLLEMLVLQGCIVTVDALGCQTKIAPAIREANADYLLWMKANQGQLYDDLQDWFAHAEQTNLANMTHRHNRIANKDRRRLDVRECWLVSDPMAFAYIRHYDGSTVSSALPKSSVSAGWGKSSQPKRPLHCQPSQGRAIAYVMLA